MVEDGRLKVLAVTSTQRAAELPDKPTIAESGYPNYETSYWIGVLGPAGLPPDIVAKLQQAFTAAAQDPAVAAQMKKQSIVPRGLPAAALDALLKKEIAQKRREERGVGKEW